MSITIKHLGRVKNSQLKFYKPEQYKKNLEAMEGKEFQLVLEDRFYDTTLDQHAYYRGGIIETCLETESFGGWSTEDVHDYYSEKFLSYTKVVILDGNEREIKKRESTAKIGKKRMAKYIDNVLNDLATMEIFPQSPDEYLVGKYKTTVTTFKSKE